MVTSVSVKHPIFEKLFFHYGIAFFVKKTLCLCTFLGPDLGAVFSIGSLELRKQIGHLRFSIGQKGAATQHTPLLKDTVAGN